MSYTDRFKRQKEVDYYSVFSTSCPHKISDHIMAIILVSIIAYFEKWSCSKVQALQKWLCIWPIKVYFRWAGKCRSAVKRVNRNMLNKKWCREKSELKKWPFSGYLNSFGTHNRHFGVNCFFCVLVLHLVRISWYLLK